MDRKNVFLAVASEFLEEGLGSCGELDIAARAGSKEEALSLLDRLCRQNMRPEAAVISSALGGDRSLDVLDVAWRMRSRGLRVIYLAGEAEPGDGSLNRLRGMGIGDIILGPAAIGTVLDVILNPCMGEAGAPPPEPSGGGVPAAAGEGKRLFRVFSRSGRPSDTPSGRRQEAGRLYRNVNVVWSPAPTGKTFVAVNHAASMARAGCSVCLLDLDDGAGVWFGMPEGASGLERALEEEGDPLVHAFRPQNVDNLFVLTGGRAPEDRPGKLDALLDSLRARVGLLVVDMPSSAHDSLLYRAANVILVADMDLSHLRRIKRELARFEEDAVAPEFHLILNRYRDIKGLPGKVIESTPVSLSGIIPEGHDAVMMSISRGWPAVFTDFALKSAFEKLQVLLSPEEAAGHGAAV
ncbi:MAG: AAA family ATPase [Bacillota bacterium]